MKRFITTLVIPAILAIGIAGCSEKETAKTEKTVKTPDGKTTETIEHKVEKSGKNPPETP